MPCIKCGSEIDFQQDYYAIRKNGNKTGSKQVGFLCNICYLEMKHSD